MRYGSDWRRRSSRAILIIIFRQSMVYLNKRYASGEEPVRVIRAALRNYLKTRNSADTPRFPQLAHSIVVASCEKRYIWDRYVCWRLYRNYL